MIALYQAGTCFAKYFANSLKGNFHMNLAMQLLQQIDNPNLSYTERARLRCKLAKDMEEAGNYEAARNALGELWRQVGTRPKLDDLDEIVAAEVLLRAGTLSGWIGSTNQIEKAQEIAKDLISESATIFEKLQETEKVAEAYIDLAICYWREGAFDEARVTLREVLSRLVENNIGIRARALLNNAIVEISASRFNEALRLLNEAAPLFEKNHSHTAKDYIDHALVEYAAASYHFEQSQHKRYQGRVEINLGSLLLSIGRLTEAHEHLDQALRIFKALKDSGIIAQLTDTRARVLLAEGRSVEAEKVVRGAVRTLEGGDESSLLAEALTTHGVALARLGQYEEARAKLGRALEVAERAGDNESAGVAAITAIEELGTQLGVDEMHAMYEHADSLVGDSQNTETLRRLRSCARLAVDAGRFRAAQFDAPNFVYADERTGELLRTAHLVAGTQATVLITGETGAGKEVLARLIHQWSGRAGEFIAVNCGALTETLFESLLFGHVRGSFTDAVRDHAGAVREAAGGTLFLDEIAELSFGSQGKLLRLIERGEIHAIGAPVPEHVDVRIVAAANCELEQRIARGEFRADLFYRLNTFHLVIPALRERPEDIAPLAMHFIEELLKLHRKQVTFMPETIEAMRRLPLKGNARELRALIERTLLTATDGAVITPSAVEALALRRLVSMATLSHPWEGCSIKAEVRDFESNLIKLALETAGGSVTHAARLLGITHQRLCAMLQSRHKSLLFAKKAARPRKRSIISRLGH
jgi:transcriptional regulator with PAS, ATPase and Fis domain/Tfp pilus assembly protein PilF